MSEDARKWYILLVSFNSMRTRYEIELKLKSFHECLHARCCEQKNLQWIRWLFPVCCVELDKTLKVLEVIFSKHDVLEILEDITLRTRRKLRRRKSPWQLHEIPKNRRQHWGIHSEGPRFGADICSPLCQHRRWRDICLVKHNFW